MTDFLVARPTDLVVLGVRWSGFRLRPGTPAVLEAIDDRARLVVTFPPQHIVEQAFPVGLADPGPAATRLAGPSQIAFVPAVADGLEPTQVVMTVAGILEALRTGRILGQDGGPGQDRDGSVLEIPWRLMWSPESAVGSQPVTCEHPAQPQVSRVGDVGLWHTRLGARGGTSVSGPGPIEFTLRTADSGVAGLPDPIGGLPLTWDNRTSIVAASLTAAPIASRLELSSLGGSLTAHGVWDNFEWDHETTLGRDQLVRVLRSGVLYPFGHRAVFVELTERRFNPDAARSLAALRGRRTLIVTEPIREPVSGDARLERAFPFSEVEITQTTFADLAEPDWHNQPVPSVFFWPRLNDLSLVQFPVRCTGTNGDLHFRLPMIFVNDLRPTFGSLTDPTVAEDLKLAWEAPREASLPGLVDVPGVAIDLVRSAAPTKSDIQEVQQLRLVGAATPNEGSFRPALDGLRVALPELRTLVGEAAPADVAVQFDEQYLAVGDAAKVALQIVGDPILVDFTTRADRSGGLVAPKFDFDGISREYGPVQVAGLLSAGPDGFLDPSQLFGLGATLLGFDLRSVVRELKDPPTIVSDLAADQSLAVTMTWEEVKVQLQELGEDRRPPNTTLELEVFSSPERTSTTCTVRNISLILPTPDTPLLELSFESVIFTQIGAKEPRLEVNGLGVEFLGLLQLLKKLQDAVDLGDSAPNIEASRDGVTAGYALPVPTVETGAFILRNILLRAE
ncbi:MAG: hypothetical protein M3400_04645, partial [Actinomycetota bacterium]|nr:hypothetical protein [Actinomycetota bacterium]